MLLTKFKFPFISEPPKRFEGNNKAAREDLEFVKSEFLRLEKLGCFKKVQTIMGIGCKKPHLLEIALENCSCLQSILCSSMQI